LLKGKVHPLSISSWIFVLLVLGIPATGHAQTYVFDKLWPQLPQPWYFNNPMGLAVDASRNVYIVDQGNLRIQVFDSNGNFVRKWGIGGYQSFHVAVHSSGSVIVADSGRIQVFDSSGTFLRTWGAFGTKDGEFRYPRGLALDASGNVLVADTNNGRIQVFDFSGNFLRKWGTSGSGDGQFLAPYDVAVDGSGNVIVADYNNERIQVFDSNGNFLRKWTTSLSGDIQKRHPDSVAVDPTGNIVVLASNLIQVFSPDGTLIRKWGALLLGFEMHGMAVDAVGNVIVADTTNNGIRVFGPDGKWMQSWYSTGGSNGVQFRQPSDVAVDRTGNIYVFDSSRVTILDSAGVYLRSCASYGYGNEQFVLNGGLAVDKSGNVIITDWGSDHVLMYDSGGKFVRRWGSTGEGDGQLRYPQGVAVDASGNIIVADMNNHRIQVFDSKGNFLRKFGSIGSGDGQLSMPTGVGVDAAGNILVADGSRIQVFSPGGNYLRKWKASGDVDGITFSPGALALDASGNVVVSERSSQRIQVFDSYGNPLAQFGSWGTDEGQLNGPEGVAVDPSGRILVVDYQNNRVQRFSLVTDNASQVTSTVPAGGTVSAFTTGPTDALAAGYASVSVDRGIAPSGTAVFSYIQNGYVVSEAGVPASPPTTAARFLVDTRTNVLTTGGGKIDVLTGFAAANPNNTTATLNLTLRNGNGVSIATGAIRIPPGGHLAKFLDQLAPDFQLPAGFINQGLGSLDVASSQPVSILALRLTVNQRGDLLITSTPVADLATPVPTGPVAFPQVADGGGYQTTLILLNTTNAVETGMVRFYGNSGAAMTVRMEGGGTADSKFAYSIPAGGCIRLITDGSPSSINVGWAQLIPDSGKSTPVSAAVFGFTQQNVLVTESGVPAVSPTTRARIYVDKSRGHDTGLALANPGDSSISISAICYQSDGVTRVGTGNIDLNSLGHDARFAGQIIYGLPDAFTGVIEISSTKPFNALTLRSLTNNRGDFLVTTFPIAVASQSSTAPLLFPQIAAGSGYQSQIILLSTGDAATGVTISYTGDDGQPVAIGRMK
jgi:sugar lactone lactonase YvrE